MLKTGLREIEVIRANVEDYQTVPEGRILWILGLGREDRDAFVVLRPEAYSLLDAYLEQRPMPSKQALAKASDPEGGIYTDEKLPLFVTVGRRGGHRLSEITIQGLVREWLKLCQVKRDVITGHSLRHTAATMALESGAPVTAVRDMLRHSSMKQTNIYVHTLDRMKRGAEQFITQY